MINRTVQIGRNKVGAGLRPLFLPDIGTFFNQDLGLAEVVIDRLADSGIQVVKGEILHSAEVCLEKFSGLESYWGKAANEIKSEVYRSLIERKVIPLSGYEQLFSYCEKKQLDVVMSVYDFTGADFARECGAVAIKIASSNITHQPLISHVCSFGLPLILDTGHSTIEEISRAVNWVTDCGDVDLIIQHSPLGPPAGVDQHCLEFMRTLGTSFGVPYGLSDHHEGDEMLYAAAALGACLIEKGVCPDGLGDEQDSGHAIPVAQVKEVYKKICNVYDGLGSPIRKLRRDRPKYRSRMGLVAKRDLHIGDKISLDTVTFAFPALGIEVERWEEVIAGNIIRPLKAGEPINWHDINANEP